MLRNGEDAAMRKTLRSTATQTVRRRLPEVAAGSVRAGSPPTATGLQAELAELASLSLDDLRLRWRNNWRRLAPAHLSRGLLIRVMAYRLGPMLGFKKFLRAATTIAGIELMHRIRKGQFKLGNLRVKNKTASEIWNAVLAA
jgi:hypothetical protein